VDEGNSVQQLTQNGNLEWSTYYGGPMDDEFFDIQTDINGNVYVTGATLCIGSTFPVTPGAIQGANLGTVGTDDAVILKFDSIGHRKWGTYYGGSANDWGNSIAIDASSNVYVTGSTWGGNFPIYPATNPNDGRYYQNNFAGARDAFLIKLNSQGSRSANSLSTYFGGSGAETGYDLKFDGNHNLFMVGTGTSASPHAPQSHAYNNTANGSGFIAKFNSNDSLIWASIIAGTEKITSIAIDDDNLVFITGSADSNLLPIVHSTMPFPFWVDSTFNGGATDIFIANFNATDSLIWSTYYGGSGEDVANAITVDHLKNIYLTGNTKSPDFPYYYYGGAYIDSTIGGNDDIFILKFKYNNSCESCPRYIREWSTFYGGDNVFDIGYDITIDYCNNIYITGSTYSNDFPLISLPNGYNDGSFNYTGSSEGFLAAFGPNLSQIWSTYFGGNGSDCVRGISSDNLHDRIYITGQSSSQDIDFPIYSPGGSPAPYLQSQNGDLGSGYTTKEDGFISRFNINPIIVVDGIKEELNKNNNDFIIYPNPCDNDFTMEINITKVVNLIISIYSIVGEQVYCETITNAFGMILKKINISNLSNGIYVIQLKGADSNLCKKLIKR